MTLDRGDHRLGQAHPRRTHRAVASAAAVGALRRSGRRIVTTATRPLASYETLPPIASIPRLVCAQRLQQRVIQCEALAVARRQCRGALREGVDSHAVDELQGAAGPGRKADAEDRADV